MSSWKSTDDGRQAISLSGEMVTLQIENLAKAKAVCVNDVLVNGPPVYRVSIRFWNESDADGDGTPDPEGTDVHYEIKLQSIDEIEWFEKITGTTYRADYNKQRHTCPATLRSVSRRSAADSTVAPGTAEAATAAPMTRSKPVHTVGNDADSLSFTFTSLGQPSEKPAYVPQEPFVEEVRARAHRSLSNVPFAGQFVQRAARNVLCSLFLQAQIGQKDFAKAYAIFGRSSMAPENSTGNFSVLLYKIQPFNFTASPDGKTVSFRSPPLLEEQGDRVASILIVDAEGAVSAQKNVLYYSEKVLPGICLSWSEAPSPDRSFPCLFVGDVLQCPEANMWGDSIASCRPCATVRAIYHAVRFRSSSATFPTGRWKAEAGREQGLATTTDGGRGGAIVVGVHWPPPLFLAWMCRVQHALEAR